MSENIDFLIVKPQQKRGFFSDYGNKTDDKRLYEYTKDSPGAAKRLVKKFPGKKIICDRECFNKEKTRHFLTEYNECSEINLLNTFKLSFYPSLEKFGIKAPLGEIYISGAPSFAVKIIEHIKYSARLFTVVNPGEYQSILYDELYFKYGIIIRQIPFFSGKSFEGELLIKADDSFIPEWVNCPVISFERNVRSSADKVALRYTVIENNFLSQAGRLASPVFYTLIAKNIDENCVVDVNKNADKIFLLDITRI